jgi:hypothetical protein
MTFLYVNRITKKSYELSGIIDLPHAWKLVSFVA